MGRLNEHDPALTSAAQRWVVRLTSGDMTDREMGHFREWVADPHNERVFERELAKWRKLGAIRNGLAGMINLPSPAQVLRRRIARWVQTGVVVSSVCLIAFLAGPVVVLHARADHIAGSQIARVDLPDGSRAVLDAGSAIAVKFANDERRVELLRGRAWFEVAHQSGPAFEVAAAGGVVQDIGTAFEVARDGNHVETAVSQGRVRVIAPGQSSIEIGAGQRARFSATSPVAEDPSVPVRRVANWRTGNIVLEGVSVRRAIAEVARYRSAPIWVWGDLDPKAPITVVLRSDRPDAALDALAAAEGLSLTKLPGGPIVVRQRPAS